MKTLSKWFVLGIAALLPVLTGASCSTSEVAEATATTFFREIAIGIADVIFTGVTGG